MVSKACVNGIEEYDEFLLKPQLLPPPPRLIPYLEDPRVCGSSLTIYGMERGDGVRMQSGGVGAKNDFALEHAFYKHAVEVKLSGWSNVRWVVMDGESVDDAAKEHTSSSNASSVTPSG